VFKKRAISSTSVQEEGDRNLGTIPQRRGKFTLGDRAQRSHFAAQGRPFERLLDQHRDSSTLNGVLP
jgi:hypothetical protein